MKPRTNLTAERLRDLLSYEEATGVFRWNRSGRGGRKAGQQAGTRCSGDYISIGVDGTTYKAHRLAWLYIHGIWPAHLIDHIDLNPSNNRIANLREAIVNENQRNSVSTRNKTGYRGVCADCRGGFFSSASRDGQRFYLGSFATASEAHQAYESFRRSYDGNFYPSMNSVSETASQGTK